MTTKLRNLNKWPPFPTTVFAGDLISQHAEQSLLFDVPTVTGNTVHFRGILRGVKQAYSFDVSTHELAERIAGILRDHLGVTIFELGNLTVEF